LISENLDYNIEVSIVSVIIPYKNNLLYFFKTIDSILVQSFKKFEIKIIYDDEDKSDLKLIRNYINKKKIKKKFKIKIFINKKNLGAGASRNIGIKLSRTKYIAFLDSDDVWHKDKLKSQVKFMENNKIPISHTSYNVINQFDKKISSRRLKKKLYFNDIINSCDIGLSTVMIDLNFLKRNNLKFPKIKTKEDYVLWLKILKKTGYILGIDKNLTNYRYLKKSLSSNKFLSLLNGYKVYNNYMKMGFIESFYRLLVLSFNYIKKQI
jgi:teichuronic acid biosynthesis glycosyltransferase TuaG